MNGCVNTVSDYTILEINGRGTYGEVFRAIHKRTGDIVALKKIAYTDVGIPKSSTREIRLLSALKHPSIVKLREIVVEDVSKQSNSIPNCFYLVFDFIDNDLAGIVRAVNKNLLPPLSSHILRSYIYQVVEVFDFLHGSHIIHRDIKLDNFLVTNDHYIKLCDFGLSRVLMPSVKRLSHPVYAIAYRSPEILLGIQPYSFSSDIWALGVLVAFMVLGRAPFTGNSDREILEDILRKCGVVPTVLKKSLALNGFSPTNASMRCIKDLLATGDCISFSSEKDKNDLLDLCDRLLDMNPVMRPTTQMILLHPFLKNRVPSSRLVPINELKKCDKPLLNMVIKDYKVCICLKTTTPMIKGRNDNKLRLHLWRKNEGFKTTQDFIHNGDTFTSVLLIYINTPILNLSIEKTIEPSLNMNGFGIIRFRRIA